MPCPTASAATLSAVVFATAAILVLPCVTAHAQRESFDGLAARTQAKAQQDRLFDLNGDGKVDDHEREMATQNLLLQNAINPNTGEIDREKLKRIRADRKRLQAEAKIRDRDAAVVEKLRERQARGQRLTDADLARIHAADESAQARLREREREAREAAKAPRSQASQRLSDPILNH